MILHGIEYQRPTSLNMRILADHVTYSFLAFMKSIFHFCLGCYCGGYSQNGRSNLSSYCCALFHNYFFPWLWTARATYISSSVIPTNCRLHSNILQILVLYKTGGYYNKFDSTKSLGMYYWNVKIPAQCGYMERRLKHITFYVQKHTFRHLW